MIGKKINELATELDPISSDLTIIGDPSTGVSKKVTLAQIASLFSGAIVFVNNYASLPATGTIDIIYCLRDTYKIYIWNGGSYVETLQILSQKGAVNGYASLDSSGKVPISQLPSSIMEYKGMWNASTNTPTLANGTGDTGDVYICNVAGSVNFGAGVISFAVGDYVIYSGSIWQRSSGAVGTVTSVALSVPSGLSVSGSPITTSGTLAITGAGNSTQYLDGTGALQTFPTLLSSDNLVKLVRNQSGATMVEGTVIYISGATGNKPLISKALATSDATSAQTYGLVQSSISNNADGYVVVIGNVSNLDTSALTEGQQLYLSGTTAGTYTTTKPYAPIHLVYVGIVLRSHPTQGIIGVKIQNGYEMDELHNVDAYLPNNNDILSYNTTTSLWEHKQIATTLGYTPANINGTGFVKAIGTSISYDNSTYLTGNQTITLSGDLSGSGATAITTTIGALKVTNGMLAGTINYSKMDGTTVPTWNQNTSGTAANITATSNSTITTLTALSLPYSQLTGTPSLSGYVTSVTGTSPIVSSGGVTPAISIPVATTLVNGYLSSTDWTTFNSKQSALTNPVTGTGTTNYLPKFTGSSTIGNSAITDTGSLITLGSSTLITGSTTASGAIARGTYLTPTLVAAANSDVLVGLDINPTFTNGAFTGVGNYAARISGILAGVTQYMSTGASANFHFLQIVSSSSTNGVVNLVRNAGSNGTYAYQLNNGSSYFSVNVGSGETTFGSSSGGYFTNLYSGGTEGLRIFGATRNVLIQNGGTFTDAGYRLDINGTSRVSGVLTLGSTITNGTYTYTLPSATGTLALVGGSGVGTVTSVAALTIGTSGTDLSSTVANSTTTPVITLNVPTASATNRGALSSADWTTFNNKYNLPSLTSGSVLFSNGSTIAQNNANFFWDDTNNRLGIGTLAPSQLLHLQTTLGSSSGVGTAIQIESGGAGGDQGWIGVNKGIGNGLEFSVENRDIIFNTGATTPFGGTERMRITSGGNVLIGTTTDSGYKLDVNGTGRFSGTVYATTGSYTMPAFSPSYFGYSSSYNVLILGNTNSAQTRSLAFNVDISGNTSGAFSGNGSEYVWRNAGSFITPNSINNGYNTLLSWNSSGQMTFTGAATFSSSINSLGINSAPTSTTTSANYIQFKNTGSDFYIGQESSTAGGFFTGSSAYASVFYGTTAQEFIIAGVRRLQIATSGAATFSSSVYSSGVLQVAPTTGTGMIGVGDNFGGNINAGIYRGGLGVTTAGNYLNIGGYDGVVVTTGNAALGSQTTRLTIASTGEATFSSSVLTNDSYNVNVAGGIGGYTGFKLRYGTASVQSLTMGQATAGNGAWIGMAQYRAGGYWQTEGTAAAVLQFESDGTFKINTNSGLTANTDYNVTPRLTISNTGAATFSSTLGINGVSDNINSGSYTPTLASEYNVASTTAQPCQYMRVGNVVTVSGGVNLTGTASNTWTRISITLPISSNFDYSYRAGGAGGSGFSNQVCTIRGGAGTSLVYLDSYPATTSSYSHNFSFTYLIM